MIDWEGSLARFTQRSEWPTFVCRPRGIWISELFAFAAWAWALGIDCIVESGIAHGQSTDILRQCFSRVYSIDHAVMPDVAARLIRDGVQVSSADAHVVLMPIVEQLVAAGYHTAVLLDGPKGEPAVELGLRCLDHGAVFFAVHDTYCCAEAPNAVRARLEAEGRSPRWAWSTDDASFVRAFSYLDARVVYLDEAGNGKSPFLLHHHGRDIPMESYGPTLTLLFPTVPHGA